MTLSIRCLWQIRMITFYAFSSRGQVYWLKVYEVPQGSRISRGKPIVNLFPLEEGEKINAILSVKEFD